jgi:hypothetical protein
VKQSLNFLLLEHWIISFIELNTTSPEKVHGLVTTGVDDGVTVGVGVGVDDIVVPDASKNRPPQGFVGVGVGVDVGVVDGVGVFVGVGGM